MDNADTPRRWYQNWRAAEPPVDDDDAADLGTAFGLDMSMDTLPAELPEPAASTYPGDRRRNHG